MVSEKNLMKEIQIKLTSEDIKIFPEPKKINLDNSSDEVLIKLGKESLQHHFSSMRWSKF